jgi:hypothetical protein
MKTIELTNTAARISSIEEKSGIFTVNLEWGGCPDRTINDFDLTPLGDVTASGGNLCGGWAVLYGDPLLQVGDTIPLLPPETELTKTDALNRLLAAGYNATSTEAGICVSGTLDGAHWSAFYADAGQDANTYNGPVPSEVDALCVWDDASTRA